PAQLVLSGVTVQPGYVGDTSGGKGAGMYVAPGSGLVLSDSLATNNTNAFGPGGGGIGNDGGATLVNVTVQGNSVSNFTGSNGGGGIYNLGTLSLTNITISGNRATSYLHTAAGGG